MAELTFYTSKYQGEEVDKVIEQIQAMNSDGTENGQPVEKIIVPVANGGIGSDQGNEGLHNLFAAGTTILSKFQYGPESKLPTNPVEGQLFFQQVDDLLTLSEIADKLYPKNSIFFTTENLANGPDFGDTVNFTWNKIGNFSISSGANVYVYKRIS